MPVILKFPVTVTPCHTLDPENILRPWIGKLVSQVEFPFHCQLAYYSSDLFGKKAYLGKGNCHVASEKQRNCLLVNVKAYKIHVE
jgi:hypothetical protein